MADEQLIKPRELPSATTVFADDAIMTDDGVTVGKATPVQIVNAGAPVPTEAEAIAGADNSKRMTPLTVKQVLDSVTAPSVMRAAAWAESSTPPDPGIPGSKSAKSWASESERLGREQAERAEAAAVDAVNNAPFLIKNSSEFFNKSGLIDGARYTSKVGASGWDVLASGNGDFIVDGKQISVVLSSPGVSISAFGVVGDGVYDDSPALEKALSWVLSAPGRKLVDEPGYRYRLASPISVSAVSGSILGTVSLNSPIVPDAGIGDAVTISEATYCDFSMRVVGSGITDAASLPDYNEPDPAGCQQAFVFNSCRACKVDVTGYGYGGRVLRTKNEGTTKLSFMTLRVRTGEGSCAQAMYLEAADSAFGVIENAQTQWDVYGSVLDGLTDITIQYWEYGAASGYAYNPALTLKNLTTAHIDVLAGGQGSSTGTVLKVDEGIGITMNKLFTTQGDIGLHVVGGTSSSGSEVNKQLTILSHFSYGTESGALKLEGVTNVDIKQYHYDSVGDHGIIFAGAIRGVRLDGYIRNPDTDCIYAEAGANLHRVFIGGRLYSAANKTLVDLNNATVQYVCFRDVDALSQGGELMKIPSSNSVVIDGGTWETTGDTLWANRPSKIVNTYRPVTRTRGASNFANGSGNGATVTISHGLGVSPTDIDLRWSQVPTSGAQLILTAMTATTFTVTLLTASALTEQVNFRWFANAEIGTSV